MGRGAGRGAGRAPAGGAGTRCARRAVGAAGTTVRTLKAFFVFYMLNIFNVNLFDGY